MSNTAIPVNEISAQRSLSKESLITWIITLIGIGLLVMGGVNLNNWRKIDPQAIAEARVAKESGLSRAQQSSLRERQFKAAVDRKGTLARSGFFFIIAGVITLWLSRQWQNWPVLYNEYMLYAYALLIPPVGWVLYLFAYPTRGDPNREIIRRNIGIVSLAVLAGIIGFFISSIIQINLSDLLGLSRQPEADSVLANFVFGLQQLEAAAAPDSIFDLLNPILEFVVSLQLAQFIGIAVGGYVAFRTRDVRAIAVAGQIIVLGIVLAIFSWLGSNAVAGIEAQNLSVTDYTFLDLTSGFDISETLIAYDRSSTYGEAFLAGFLNTLMISVVGIALATILGLFVGIARLSSNWLTSTIARAFVELMRNIPLLVLLFFLYAGVLLQLPQRADTIRLFNDSVLLNNRGVALPWYRPTETFSDWTPYLIGGLIMAVVILYFRNRPLKMTGRPAFNILYVLLGLILAPAIGWYIVSPMHLEIPFIDGLNYAKNRETDTFVGLVMSPEFFGVLLGLILYTGAFIGEIVRAGINSVSIGQREAARAIGLTQPQSMQLIILPQALRVIVPPLTNQYLNLAKNSSLAIAIGYADLFFVANTTFNQSGQSVQVILMIMVSYLAISLTISVIMNRINQRIQLKER